MTISPLNFDAAVSQGSDLVAQAVIRRPVSFFERKRMRFTEGYDDLDRFQATALLLDGTHLVALVHYRGTPDDTVTVFLPKSVQDISDTILFHLVEELDLPRDSVVWTHDRDIGR